MRKIVFGYLALFASASCLAVEPSVWPATIRVGITETTVPNINSQSFDLVEQTLRRTFGNQVEVNRFSLETLAKKIRNEELDLVFCTPGYMWSLGEVGMRPLVALVSKSASNPNHATGSTFFVKKESPVQKFKDMKGLRLATSYTRYAYTNYDIAMGEVARRGYDYEKFFPNPQALGGNVQTVLDALRNGKADVGVLRVCALELSGNLQTNEFRVIGDQNSSEIACRTSTRLYPNLTLFITPSAPQQIAGPVTREFLNQPPFGPDQFSWDIATNYTDVDDLYRELKVGVYEYLRYKTVRQFIEEYLPYFVLVFALLAGLLLHMAALKYLVRRRTLQLTTALTQQRELEKKAAEAAIRIDRLQRESTVSQLSSLFAHEVRQPLSSIKLYIRGMYRSLEAEQENPTLLRQTLDKIATQVSRINDIIEHVRGYAKADTGARIPLNLEDALATSVVRITESNLVPHKVTFIAQAKGLRVICDPWELDVIVFNLIKNASEAMESYPDETISVIVSSEETQALITVSNGGGVISDEVYDNLGEPFSTTKTGGLGLGLSIVRGIAERYLGHLSFHRKPDGGLEVELRLPLAK